MYLGIDLGGTKIAYALSEQDLNFSNEQVLATANERDAVFEQLVEIISNNQSDLKAVGIGTPGMIDNKGKVINAPNLKGWNDFDLLARLQQIFPQLNIQIENDANCAAIAENLHGPASKYQNFIYITVSTGIGGTLSIVALMVLPVRSGIWCWSMKVLSVAAVKKAVGRLLLPELQ